MLSSTLGIPISECMSTHSNRQLQEWVYWHNEQYNHPSRTDYYLMQIACKLTQILALIPGKPPTLDLNSFKIKFETVPKPVKSISKDELIKRAAMSRAAWIGLVFGNRKK